MFEDTPTTRAQREEAIRLRRQEKVAMVARVHDELDKHLAEKTLQEKFVYVIERHDPVWTETKIVGVWHHQNSAWEYVIEELQNEQVRIENEERNSSDATDASSGFKIIQSGTSEEGQKYYVLSDDHGIEILGYYITGVLHHE